MQCNCLTLLGESIGGLSLPWRRGVFDSVGQQHVNARAVVARRSQRVRRASSASAHAPLHDNVVWGTLVHDFTAHYLQAGIGGCQFAARQRKWIESWRGWLRRRRGNGWHGRWTGELPGLSALRTDAVADTHSRSSVSASHVATAADAHVAAATTSISTTAAPPAAALPSPLSAVRGGSRASVCNRYRLIN